MQTPATAIPSASTAVAAAVRQGAPGADAVTRQSETRAQVNASIIQASYEVSLSSGNDSLAVLYRTAIDRLNEVLKPELGDNAIQNAAGQDHSPEGTAGRIVSLSTGFFEAFKKIHPGEDEGALLTKFMETIRGGFEKGYKEASDILSGLNVLNGDVAAGIAQTYDLVLRGYADFEAAQRARLSEAAAPAATSTTATSATSSATAATAATSSATRS